MATYQALLPLPMREKCQQQAMRLATALLHLPISGGNWSHSGEHGQDIVTIRSNQGKDEKAYNNSGFNQESEMRPVGIEPTTLDLGNRCSIP